MVLKRVHPDGRVVSYDYDGSGSMNHNASRIASLVDSDAGATHLAGYQYLGFSSVALQTSPVGKAPACPTGKFTFTSSNTLRKAGGSLPYLAGSGLHSMYHCANGVAVAGEESLARAAG